MRCTVLAGCVIAMMGGRAAAQTPGSVNRTCYRARPRPACQTFFLTNAGVFQTLVGASRPDDRLGAAADWTVMFNVSDRDAVGFGAFGNVNPVATGFGAQVTYRRWLRGPASLDFAVGIPLASDAKLGSVYGTIRWNPIQSIALTARPEWLRTPDFVCAPVNCVNSTRSRARFSLGVELGEAPGLVAGVIAGLSGLAMMLLMAGAD
jgi:hypothetical protein